MVKSTAAEWQFDGLVGPTHNYAGLSFGNIASEKNAGRASNPKAAALQGLEKMRLAMGLGMRQAFLPPQKRPMIPVLQQMGFGQGSSRAAIAQTIDNAYKNAPHLLAAAYSSSFMWAANAATVSPSADTADGKLHLTPANLISHFHRSVEAGWMTALLKNIFHNESLFTIHNALPATLRMADEGAANTMRICNSHGDKAIEIFVHGVSAQSVKKPNIFPARQHREAYDAIARMHRLDESNIIHIQQSPESIDAGVFHNDVIAMNTTRLMVVHRQAFVSGEQFITKLKQHASDDFSCIEIADHELSLAEAVETYLFNSQLIELPSREMALLAPGECETHPAAQRVIRRLVEQEKVVTTVHYLNVRESMRNGGGPACLRLRVVMTPEEAAAMHPGVVVTEPVLAALFQWVSTYYRDRLLPDDLRDPALLDELDTAYAALESILGMPGLYNL